MRELRSLNTEYIANISNGCIGQGNWITIPCQVYATLPRPQLTPTSDCSAADGQLRFRTGAISQCATGGESRLELRDRSGNVYQERETSTYLFYENLPSQVYEMHVIGVEGCSVLVDTFDLRLDHVLEVLTDVQPACPGVANGGVHFEIFALGTVPTVTIDGRPLSLRDVGYDTYVASVDGLAGGDYLLEVTAGACTMPYPVTVPVPQEGNNADRLYFGLFGEPKEANICVGRASTHTPLHISNGTPPYVFEWSDGERQELSDYFGRHFYSGGLFTAVVTDHCGLTGEVAVRVIDQRQLPPISITYASSPDGECGPARIQFAPDFDPSPIRSATVNGVRDVSLRSAYFPRGATAEVSFEYIRGACRDTTFVIPLGETLPTVVTQGSCQGQDNGGIQLRIARPPSVPVLSIGDVPEVPFTRNGDTIYATLDGLEAPKEYSYTLTYPNTCRVESYAQVNRAPQEKEFVRYDHDDLACTFDLVCNGERIDGFRFQESPTSDPDYHSERCRSFLTCGDVRVREVGGRNRQVKVWLYRMLVEQAYNAGVISYDYYIRGKNSVWGLGGCSTVGYCTATMQTGAIWSNRPSEPISIDEDGDCLRGHCPEGFNRRQKYCDLDKYLPPGASFNPGDHHAISCSYGEISLKQLAIWDPDLRHHFPETYREAAAGEPQNLRDLAKEIAAEFGKQATHIDPTPHHISAHIDYTKDPLWCAKVRFCRQTFEVISYDHWDDVDCYEVFARGPGTSPVATCKAPIQGSNLNLCPDSGYPTSVISVCSPLDAGNNTWSNGPRITVHHLCFQAGPFAERPAPPPPGTVTSIPAYYVDSQIDFHVPVIDRDSSDEGDEYLPKVVNDFGSRQSFSEFPVGATETDHLLIQDLEHLAEVVTEEDDYFRLALTAPRDDGERLLAKDDGYGGIVFPAGLDIESIATDVALTSVIFDSEEALPLEADGVTHDLPPGRSLVTFDYSEDIAVEQIVPLPDPGFLIIDPDDYRPLPTYHELVGSVAATALLTHDRRAGTAILRRLSRSEAPAPRTYAVSSAIDTVLASPTLSPMLLGLDRRPDATAVHALTPDGQGDAPLLTFDHATDSSAALWNVSRHGREARILIHGSTRLQYGGDAETLSPTGIYRVSVTPAGLDVELVVELGEVRLDAIRTDDAQSLSLAINVPGDSFTQLGDHTVFNASPYRQSARHVAYLNDAPSASPDEKVSGGRYILYPSPARDYVTVKAFDGLDGAGLDDTGLDYVIYASDGRPTLKGSVPPAEGLRRTFRIGLESVPAGAYIVSVSRGSTPPSALKLMVVR